jgi:hypothetical protein
MAKAIAKTENKAEKEFGAAFKIDVINSLPATI